MQNVLKRQILTDSTANIEQYDYIDVNVGASVMFLNSVVFPLRSKLFNFKSMGTPLNFL